MKNRVLAIICLVATLATAGIAANPLYAQDTPGPMGPGRRGGGGGFGGGRTIGTVTEVASDHLTIKNENGEVYKVLISDNTRFMKDRQPSQASDLKVGDVVMAMGKPDESAKTIGAAMVAVLNPDQVKQMQEMQASYGKTWVAGKITAINETKITITGRENTTYNLVVDENTSFKKRRDSITLADVKVGDMVNAKGAQKNGTFAVTELSVMEMGPPRGGMMPPPDGQQQPK